jgi:hypothetical protein
VRLLVEVLIVQRFGPIHLHHIRHMRDYQSIHHELKESEACSWCAWVYHRGGLLFECVDMVLQVIQMAFQVHV